jgi:hypothetical protein
MLSTRDMVVIVVVVLALDLLSCGRKALAAEMRGREADHDAAVADTSVAGQHYY